VPHDDIVLTKHAAERTYQRLIEVWQIEDALANGKIIERYTDRDRYLVCGWVVRHKGLRERLSGQELEFKQLKDPLHVVASDDDEAEVTTVITVYDPRTQPEKWTDDYETRREAGDD